MIRQPESKVIGRQEWADIARGIVIVIMILAHMPNYTPAWFRAIASSFHMPFFFILAGYFFNPNGKKCKKYIEKKLRRLLLPYFIFNFVFILTDTFFFGFNVKRIKEDLYNIFILGKGVSILWFFWVLFGVEIVFFLILHFLSKKKSVILIAALILFGAGCSFWRVELFWAIPTIMLSLSFYGIGYVLKIFNLLDYLSMPACFLFWLLSFLIVYLHDHSVVLWNLSGNECSNFFFCFVTAIAGTLLIVQISKYLSAHKLILGKFFAPIGLWSLYIYPLSKWLPDFFKAFFKSYVPVLAVNATTCAVVSYLVGYILLFLLIRFIIFKRAFMSSRNLK
ncbi:acyltransferase family protein [Bifidobacterium adolescentis]|uniref:acyltransferase family protein n=1 Tax=Bifidobacterium adolescentis TaxID=1680 RepID=UPI000E35892A|nr:acyltransferase family protein [Bifidobacterium adolescentis]AXR42229.1 hypothetical protein CKK50_07775 [Bifidobacterium adolescentis]